ncbi:MAG: hypothetical protein LC713_06010 [Actinobacteria bacterium]|nr:hypothetical protein [Actinomycetota bacterium]
MDVQDASLLRDALEEMAVRPVLDWLEPEVPSGPVDHVPEAEAPVVERVTTPRGELVLRSHGPRR